MLHVALQEGFAHDEVRIAVDGREVFHERDVSTRLQIGLAAKADVEAERGRHELTVSVRGIASTFAVEMGDAVHVGISLDRSGTRIEHRVSGTPFGYA
jgi:hypothetical protein